MNIIQAKKIDLTAFLSGLGFSPERTDPNGDKWYRSPFRDESTPSFKVSKDGYAWTDFGEAANTSRTRASGKAANFAGGTIIDFALHFWRLQASDVSGALDKIRTHANYTPTRQPDITKRTAYTPKAAGQIIDNILGSRPTNPTFEPYQKSEPTPRPAPPPKEAGLILEQVFEFSVWLGRGKSRNLSPQAQYLVSRGLDPAKCSPFISTVKFRSNRPNSKSLYALGFQNQAGGYELRANMGKEPFKGVAGGKDITLIEAKQPNHRLHIFEGFPDFLTALHLLPETMNPENENFLVLNGATLIERAKAVIENGRYSTLILWLQNDPTGEKIEPFFLNLPEELNQVKEVGSMSHLYQGEKDLNIWFVKNKDLPQIKHEVIKSMDWHKIGVASHDIFNKPKPM